MITVQDIASALALLFPLSVVIIGATMPVCVKRKRTHKRFTQHGWYGKSGYVKHYRDLVSEKEN